MLLRLDDIEIDTATFELRQAGEVVPTEPLVFDLIRFMAENPGRLISRDEVIERVWKGRIVSDATVSGCVKAARKALGDNGTEQKFIRTVRGRGFQFTADVVQDAASEPPIGKDSNTRGSQKLSSLVILPFDTFGDDAELRAIADGLVENMTTALVRVPLLSLASRTSSFALKGAVFNAQDIGTRLGVAYMLEGSLQRIGDTVRANIQLIETDRGFHLWAQQFDAPLGPEAMDSFLQVILPRLETRLIRAIFDSLGQADGALSAHQLLLRAIGLLALKGWHRDTFEEAAGLLRQVVAMEPDLALAHAHLSLILGLGHRVGLLDKSEAVAREAVAEAEEALRLDNMDSITVALAACALADVGHPKRAVPLLERAIDLNPNNGHAWAALGSAHLLLRQPKRAVENLAKGVSISPLDARLSVWVAILALAYLKDGDLEAAEASALKGCQADDRAYIPRVVLAAVHLAGSKHDAAVSAIRDGQRAKPDLTRHEILSLVGKKAGAALEQMLSEA